MRKKTDSRNEKAAQDGSGNSSLDSQGFRRVLVLNRNWQAVNIIGVKRAFSLLWQGNARVLDVSHGNCQPMTTEEWLEHSRTIDPIPPGADWVRTIRMNIMLPKVVLLNDYDRLPIAEVKFNRHNVFERDNFTCQYTGRLCKVKDLTIDHVIPRDRGGRTSWENVVACARDVNETKANRLPHEAGMRLLRKPERPKWRPFVSVAAGSDIDPTWGPFLHVEKSAS